jgi:transcriptional regulator of NAD metabolism
MNNALQKIIQELPAATIKSNYATFLDALFHILNVSHDHIVYQLETETKKTLDNFFEKVGVYQPDLLETADKDIHNSVLDKVIS